VTTPQYEHLSFDVGMKVDASNVGEILALLDELD